MAQVVKDLLATTSLLFDKSDALNDELQKLVKSAQRSSTQRDQEELTKVVVAGLDTSSVSLLATGAGAGAGAGGEAGVTVLQRALADCQAAAASIKKLHENRDAVVDARAEAIKVQEQLAREKAEKLADEISQSTKCVSWRVVQERVANFTPQQATGRILPLSRARAHLSPPFPPPLKPIPAATPTHPLDPRTRTLSPHCGAWLVAVRSR